LKSDKRFEKTEVGISGDVIMNGDSLYVLVHQYDRIEQLNTIITNKYK